MGYEKWISTCMNLKFRENDTVLKPIAGMCDIYFAQREIPT